MTDSTDPVINMAPSGRWFDLAHPERTPVLITDLAYHLAGLNRYTGGTRYSVAQHSYYVSLVVPQCDALAALMHDCEEAVFGDDSSPKKLLIPELREHGRRIRFAIFDQFGIPCKISHSVKHADTRMLATEKRDLMPTDVGWPCLVGVEPYGFTVMPWSAETAERKFLERFYELTEQVA